MNVLDSLNAGLHRAFQADERVYLLGEDVLDPYGGAFRVSRGLSSEYPQRVITTPISEAGIVGVATGMALRGLRPVVEIMFGDFLTLAADQLINHAAKFRYMYNEAVRVPLVVRTPMGGRRGYGPTHSQSLEKYFLGVPGLRVLAPTTLGEPGRLLEKAILENEDPLLFVENKLLYLLPLLQEGSLGEFEVHTVESDDSFVLRLQGAPPPTLTIAAYGYMAELARQAMLRLAYELEIFTELVIPTQLSPFTSEPLLASAVRTGQLLVLEEGTITLGWGAEVIARCAESTPNLRRYARLAAPDQPIPASRPQEEAVLPGVDQILQSAVNLSLGN